MKSKKARIDEFFEHRAEIHRSMLNMATEYFKYMAILNGGAAAGIVSSIDELIKIIERTSLKLALLCFSLGLILNAVALLSTYFNQACIRAVSHAALAHLVAHGTPHSCQNIVSVTHTETRVSHADRGFFVMDGVVN